MADATESYAEQLLGLVNDAARTVSGRFVTFLTVGVYVGVTIASTTDEKLVRGILVTLPLLNSQIPISGVFGFYTIAPWLIVALHADLLVQLSALGTKLGRLMTAVDGLPDPTRRERLCERLASYHYVEFLARRAPSRILHAVSGITMCVSMIVLPLVLLCWTLVRFLPLHDPVVTSSQRLAVFADVVLILFFLWRPLSARRNGTGTLGVLRRLASLRTVVLALSGMAVVICLKAPAPEAQHPGDPWFRLRNLDLRERVLTANELSADTINALRDGDVLEREKQLLRISPLNCLQGRDLRYANFFNAVLPLLDLRSLRIGEPPGEQIIDTRLEGADFRWAQMQKVLLEDADLRRALLQGAQLQGGRLGRARLEGADLSKAQLQDANLAAADLRDTNAREAHFEGADLSGARFEGASLAGASLQGASLREAQLQYADLTNTGLEGADLSGADLTGATLRDARITGAILVGTNLPLQLAAVAQLDVAEPDKVAKTLARLACADAYVARGLAAQALSSATGRRQLAVVLSERASRPKCKGMQLLPEAQRDELERQAEILAPKA